MHDPSPRLIVVKGIGLFSSGNNYKDAIIAIKTKWPKDNSGPIE